MTELLAGIGLAAIAVSGWIAAYLATRRLVDHTEELGDLRVENNDMGHDLKLTRAQLTTEKEQHAHWLSESARLSGKLADCEERRIADADTDDLADLSSRGVRRDDQDGDEDRAAGGPVPSWVRPDPEDS